MLWLEFGGDLEVSSNGSLVLANGWDEARQTVERAILTNPQVTLPSGQSYPADYIFDTAYGAGLGLWVGQNPTNNALSEQERIIRNTVLSQSFVNPAVTPTVVFTPFNNGEGVQIFISFQLLTGAVGTVVLQSGG